MKVSNRTVTTAPLVRLTGMVLMLLAATAPAAVARTVSLTAVGVRVGDHPGFRRVVVDFTDGRVPADQTTVLDARPPTG